MSSGKTGKSQSLIICKVIEFDFTNTCTAELPTIPDCLEFVWVKHFNCQQHLGRLPRFSVTILLSTACILVPDAVTV